MHLKRVLAVVSLVFAGTATMACGDEEEGGQGTQCCALSQFCSTCTTCDSSESTIGDSTDETACQQVNDHFVDVGQYCHPGNRAPQHDITEFIAGCT